MKANPWASAEKLAGILKIKYEDDVTSSTYERILSQATTTSSSSTLLNDPIALIVGPRRQILESLY